MLTVISILLLAQMTEIEQVVMLHFDEERRMLHVAVTRGRRRVFITYITHYTNTDTHLCPIERSPFLDELIPLADFKFVNHQN